ncbi:hypothetical protein EVJ58_g6439 [Rhodofomes roseus]|uniref:Uncharacterized protein n=1 Tax=Rhodofomes roseus TaxID=34475 RepID=A0A4Y9YA14_9APHY|nr:hypothetical protein EVJ58_g6439 [Rhodofomes roseus]
MQSGQNVTSLMVKNSYVSAAALVQAFPNVKATHVHRRRDPDDWNGSADNHEALLALLDDWNEQANDDETLPVVPGDWNGPADDDETLLVPETPCWGELDYVYGDWQGLARWQTALRVRWLMLSMMYEREAEQLPAILQRTSPIILSLERFPTMIQMGTSFWGRFVRSAPRIRYLDLTLSSDTLSEVKWNWTCLALQSLSQLPLEALRLPCVEPSGFHASGHEALVTFYPHTAWHSVMCRLAAEIAGSITSLRVISVGQGVLVRSPERSLYRFCGTEVWWRIVPNDEPGFPEDSEDGDKEDSIEGRKDAKDGEGEGEEEGEGEGEGEEDEEQDGDSVQTLTVVLGPKRSRRMVPISRDLGDHIRAYLESSEFTETSLFNDELLARLERTVVPREPVSEL